jgi:hypothetical protein
MRPHRHIHWPDVVVVRDEADRGLIHVVFVDNRQDQRARLLRPVEVRAPAEMPVDVMRLMGAFVAVVLLLVGVGCLLQAIGVVP